jgi:hypothetical protein
MQEPTTALGLIWVGALQNAKLDDGYAFGDQRWKIEYMPLNS